MPMMRRRRPLLRAAAVGGGAYMAGKHRERSQQNEYDQNQRLDDVEAQQAAPAPVAAGGMAPDAMQQLKQLGELHEQGILTDEEFSAQKGRILNR